MLKQGWSAFDVDGKGYINADDLRRVSPRSTLSKMVRVRLRLRLRVRVRVRA